MLLLASTSTYRRALLERLGVPFSTRAPACDEDHDGLKPDHLAPMLARRKADSLAGHAKFILAGDQVAALGSEILSKPGTEERARAQLRQLSGKTHRLITAVTLRDGSGTHHEHVEVHHMTMRELDDASIERYVAFDQPLDCCGAYKIESRGISLFTQVRGNDFTAIEGMPLMGVAALLRSQGFEV